MRYFPQVFGKLISDGSPTPPSEIESMESSYEDVDLREHMVGILFSRSKLTHLQKQVIYIQVAWFELSHPPSIGNNTVLK